MAAGKINLFPLRRRHKKVEQEGTPQADKIQKVFLHFINDL